MIGIGVYGGILATIGVWSLARPAVALAMVYLLFALDQWGFALASAYIPTSAFTNYVGAGMIAAAIAVLFLYGRPHRLLSGVVFWLTLALFVYAFASTFWSPAHEKAMEIWSVEFYYLVVFLCLAPLLVQNIDDVDVSLRALLLIGTPFLACLDFLLEWGYRGFVVDGEVTRLPLALGQFGGYLVIVGALLSSNTRLWHVIRILAVIFGALLILKTGARGQFLSAAICTALLYGIGNTTISPIKLILAAMFGAAAVMLAYFAAITYMASDPTLASMQGRWSLDRLTEDYGERSVRVIRIEKMIEAWRQSPATMVMGVGNSAGYDPKVMGCTSPIGCYPHNLLVEILTEEGIVGLGLYLAMITFIGWKALQALGDPNLDRYYKPALQCLLAFVLFEFLLSLKQSSLLGNWRLFLFMILLDRAIDFLRNPIPVIEEIVTPRTAKARALMARRPNGYVRQR